MWGSVLACGTCVVCVGERCSVCGKRRSVGVGSSVVSVGKCICVWGAV